MHIPDGFLSPSTYVPLWGLAGLSVTFALRRAKKNFNEKMVPLMGVTSAFIFAAQMINIPVAGGTSGHLLGGLLAAILLGPSAGVLILALILAVQCLIFQDGGLTALGANIVNMGLIGSAFSFAVYSFMKQIASLFKIEAQWLLVFISAWLSVVLASLACSFELAFSGTAPFSLVGTAMLSVHSLIGIFEGALTSSIVLFLAQVRPDLLEKEKERKLELGSELGA